MSLRPLHVAVLVFVTFLWGMNFAAAKIGLEQLPPILMVALRWALVGLCLVPFVPRPHGQWRQIFMISITLGLLHFSLMFWGLARIDASTAAIAIQLQVPFAAVLAAVIFKDNLGWWRFMGMAVAIAGIVVVAGEPKLEGRYTALAIVVAAACLWSVANMQIKLMGKINGMVLNGWIGVFAAPQLALASWLLEDGQLAALQAADWRAYASILYQAVPVVIVGYGLWFHLLRKHEVNQVMPFILLVPIFGVMSGILILGETISLTFVLGGLLTVIGVGIILLRRPRLGVAEVERN